MPAQNPADVIWVPPQRSTQALLATSVETLTIGGVWQAPGLDDKGTSGTRVAESALREIARLYEMAEPPAIEAFLGAHPVVVELLLEAWRHIDSCFAPAPQVRLELVQDPEDDAEPELFAYIRTSLSVEEALAKLRQFDDEWFLDRVHRVAGQLEFSVEFA